jgi:nucleotide-binding universal stress UspA family protein
MKTLFVCTDFSSTGNNAVKFAVQYASSIKCNLVVFHVMRMPKFSPTITKAAFLELEKKEETTQKKKLEVLMDKIYQALQIKKNALRLKVAVKNGIFVTETLVAAAKKYKADLVIVGTHGATGLKLFGSTSSEVIFQAQSPVMAIPPRYRYKKLKTIVYASDLKNLVNELRFIIPIASPAKAEIEILNLNLGFGNTQSIIDEKELMKQVKYKNLKVITKKEGKGSTIIAQLQHYLKSHRPEVLVMFPEERSLFDKLFVRSKTEELVYEIKIPLLTFLKSRIK